MKGSISRQLLWICVFLLLTTNTLARKGSGSGSGGSSSGGSGSGGSGSGGSSSGGSSSGGSSSGGSSIGGSSSGSGNGGSGGSSIGGSSGQQHTYPPSNGWSGTTYRPPQNINYGSNSFPVSQTPPPAYVYQIRDSGSRYNNLLTGLALWNLGRNRNQYSHSNSNNEVCLFRLSSNGTTEDRRVNCQTMSTFIREWEENSTISGHSTVGGNSTVEENDIVGGNDTVVENVDLTNSTFVDALDDKGQSILAGPGMTCYIVRSSRGTTTTRQVDCGLLQAYTANSWRTNSAQRLMPAIVLMVIQVVLFKIL